MRGNGTFVLIFSFFFNCGISGGMFVCEFSVYFDLFLGAGLTRVFFSPPAGAYS